jgi:hypothetical protein
VLIAKGKPLFNSSPERVTREKETSMPIAKWSDDWAWGLPLVVLTVLVHISGLVLIGKRAFRASSHAIRRLSPTFLNVVILGSTTLLVTIPHGIEAAIWTAA